MKIWCTYVLPWKQLINLSQTKCLSELWKIHCFVVVESKTEMVWAHRNTFRYMTQYLIAFLIVYLQMSMSVRSITEAASTDAWTPEAPTIVNATQASVYTSMDERVSVREAQVSQEASITADRLVNGLGLNFWTLSPLSTIQRLITFKASVGLHLQFCVWREMKAPFVFMLAECFLLFCTVQPLL